MKMKVKELLKWLEDKPSESYVKVEINDTMETRLVIVPVFSERLMGKTPYFHSIESYEAGNE